ncbi:MAG TPA: metallophosphoesterase [Planctomycetota bacterium]|jgi:3',5'-cyclic AMP phosphodiesterase CpdA
MTTGKPNPFHFSAAESALILLMGLSAAVLNGILSTHVLLGCALTVFTVVIGLGFGLGFSRYSGCSRVRGLTGGLFLCSTLAIASPFVIQLFLGRPLLREDVEDFLEPPVKLNLNQKMVPPDGVSPFDPLPLMDRLDQLVPSDHFRFAVLGDARCSPRVPALCKWLDDQLQPPPDFVLTTGDMVVDGAGSKGPPYWERLALDAGPSMRKRPWWPAIGNHELVGGEVSPSPTWARDPYTMPENQTAGVEMFKRFYGLNADHYSFSFRNATFIFLPWRYPEGETEAWLAMELYKASSENKHIFVINHMPFFTVGIKSDVPNRPTALTKLFSLYGVRAVFSGHDHIYYRTVREEVPYIISAGGGAPIYSGLRAKEALTEDVFYCRTPADWPGGRGNYLLHHGASGRSDRFSRESAQFVCVVEVDGQKVTMRCVTPGGEVLDEMVLAR